MANNEYVNKVLFGDTTVMDISDTTAEEEDVIEGQAFYTKSGAPATGSLGDATTSKHGLMSVSDKIKLDNIDKNQIYKIIDIPANVISFNDGADNLPMALKIGIEPVQDLHGYDMPWPAGGNKNQYNKDGTDTTNGYSDGKILNSNGEETVPGSSQYWEISEYIKVDPSTAYMFSGSHATSSPTSIYCCEYDSSKNVIQANPQGYASFTFTTSATTQYVRLTIEKEYKSTIQFEKGSSATDYAPYSNICPISGWTGCNVTRTGKNLLKLFDTDSTHRGVPITKENGVVKRVGTWDSTNLASGFSITGATISSSNYSNYINTTENNTIKLKPGTYTASAHAEKSTNASGMVVYFATFNSLGGTLANGSGVNKSTYGDIINQTKTWTFTLTEEEYFYCGINSSVASNGTAVDWEIEVQLEVSNSASTFEPYQGNTYDITFPSSAGTVYGGTLTVNKDGTGALVVDRILFEYDGTETGITWGFTENSGVTMKNAFTSEDNVNQSILGKCNEFKWQTRKTLANLSVGEISYSTNGSNYQLNIKTGSSFATLEDFKTHLGTNHLQICVSLETPEPYQLTALEVIETLKGINNIFADTGSISYINYFTNNFTDIDEYIKIQNNSNIATLSETQAMIDDYYGGGN